MNSKLPYIIDLSTLGQDDIGFLTVAQFRELVPFEINRVFWTYQTPANVKRGRHAHYMTEMLLISIAGQIEVYTEMPDGQTDSVLLDSPDKALFIPRLCWHTMTYTPGAIQLVLASTEYNESDYIRDYQVFKEIK